MALLTERKFPRREFLTMSAGVVVSAAAMPHAAAAQKAPDAEWRNRQSGMTYRRLGRTGLMVSSIGMGGDDIRPEGIDYVLWSMDMGLNYFDTAPQYGGGASERGYGAVLKARGRDKVIQNTKVNAHPNRMMRYQEIFRSLPEAEQEALRNKAAELVAQKDLENADYLGAVLHRARGRTCGAT